MQYALLGFLIVLVIAYFVVVWKAAPHWRWYHLVAVSILMLLAVIFLFPTAGVLRSRSAWHQLKEDLEVRLAQEKAERQELKFGDPSNPAAGPGVVPLAQELSKLGMEAGRRWRNLRLQEAGDAGIVLVQPPREGEEPDAGADPQPLVPEGLVVYGFGESPRPEAPVPVPGIYLGEFRVTASGPNQVTVVPTGQLMPSQRQAIGGREAESWSLYELLPLDGHVPFMAEGSSAGDDNIFGRPDEDLIRELLGEGVDEATLQAYLRDGSEATPDDPPATRWVKIEFTDEHTITVDSPEQRGALDGGFFDANGRAVDSRLQLDGDDADVQFRSGEQIVLKEEAAEQLIEQGVAKLIDRYYVRPLNDYRYVLRTIRLRLSEAAARKSELEFEKQVLNQAIEKTTWMIGQNQETRDKLEKDLAQIQVERSAIDTYLQKVRMELEQTQRRLGRLYQSNRQLERELEQIHLAITRRADALTGTP